jgi:hypothetical protein
LLFVVRLSFGPGCVADALQHGLRQHRPGYPRRRPWPDTRATYSLWQAVCPGRWRLGHRRLRGRQLGSRGRRLGNKRVEGRRWLLTALRLGLRLGLGFGLGRSTHAFQE